MRIQYLQEGLSAAKDVILLGREANFLEQYRIHNFESARAAEFQSTLQQLPRLWLEFLSVSGLAILVISMLLQGRELETVLPTLGLFGAAAFRLIPSVNRVLGTVQALRYGLPVIDILLVDLKLVPLAAQSNKQESVSFHTILELSEINFGYPEAANLALKNVSLNIQRGESIGLIGASGAGKSTVVDILLGLLTPQSGVVSVDGENIQTDLRRWQDQIGYVPQSIFLTDDTLRRNVAFGLSAEQIDETAVQSAISLAQLDEYVMSLPEGLDTVVGERGVKISGGQRQRIGIARALYHNPAVLVMDEATSALDTSTEDSVMEAIVALHGSKTIVVIAHRLSTVAHCDRVYRLDAGGIVEVVNKFTYPEIAPTY
jgi:ABC-type multidrug transport system fused ATPase/permease subunit